MPHVLFAAPIRIQDNPPKSTAYPSLHHRPPTPFSVIMPNELKAGHAHNRVSDFIGVDPVLS